ncbi:serine hydrolase domain-containing protein [Streptomyces violaceorubidus]
MGDLRTGEPRLQRDRYRVGSITKTFVATVLLQLEAEGRLWLDTVDEWLPGLVTGHGHDGGRITLRRLLEPHQRRLRLHGRQGFARDHFLKDGFFEHRYDTVTPRELVAIAMAHEPDFVSGASWNYSNTNYVLAGLVIEEATGRPYGDEVRRRIIEPLGLRATSIPGTRTGLPEPSSRAYSKLAPTATGPTYDVTRLNPSIAGASGEAVSSSADLNRFYTALFRGRLLPAKQLAEMTTTVPAREGADYGLGLIKRRLDCGVTVWGHAGASTAPPRRR